MHLKENIELIQGQTYTSILRWETAPIVRKAITDFTWTGGTARITAVGHGLVNGWNAALTGLPVYTFCAIDDNNIRDSEYHQVTVISPDIIEFNGINASRFKPYVSGGFIQYNSPVDLTDMAARMMVKANKGEYNMLKVASITTGVAGTTKPTAAGVDGGVTWEATTPADDVANKEWIAGATYEVDDVVDVKSLLFLTVGNGRIVIDTALKTIKRTIDAQLIAGLTWKIGYFDTEAFTSDATPIVTLLTAGKITVTKEQTR